MTRGMCRTRETVVTAGCDVTDLTWHGMAWRDNVEARGGCETVRA